MTSRERVAAALTLALATLSCTAAEGEGKDAGPAASEAQKLLREGHVAQAFAKARRTIEADPAAAAAMLHALQSGSIPEMPMGQAYVRAKEEGTRLLNALRDVYERSPSPRAGTNLARAADYLRASGGLAVISPEVKAALAEFLKTPNLGPEAYYAVADYQNSCLRKPRLALQTLGRAEAEMTGEQREGEWGRLIAWSEAELLVKLDGFTPEALAALCRVIRRDKRFGSNSNWALNQLGVKALQDKDVPLAEAYLVLAGQVRPDPVLMSFGYETILARRLIEAGRTALPLRYLKRAHEVQGRPHHDTLYLLALAEMKQGNLAQAERWLHEYEKVGYKPEEEQAKELLRTIREQREPATDRPAGGKNVTSQPTSPESSSDVETGA